MLLSAHQPAYLPWLGYIDKIARADLFVYLDTVQFEKNSFINRNRIKTPRGAQWLTVPVRSRGHLSDTLRNTEVESSQPWAQRHLRSIRMNYARARHFAACQPKLEALLAGPPSKLAELCWEQLRFWLAEFSIATPVVRASSLAVSGHKSELILQLCRHFGADRFLAGALGRHYLVAEEFRGAGIELEFQSYDAPQYEQLWGEFVPHLSVVDYWMNCGADARVFHGHA
jgi:WbqC-like protein family